MIGRLTDVKHGKRLLSRCYRFGVSRSTLLSLLRLILWQCLLITIHYDSIRKDTLGTHAYTSNFFWAFVFCVSFVDALIKVASESTKCRAAFNWESVSTHNKSSSINTRRDDNILQSASFFLMVMRQRAWLVSKRNGVNDLSCVELASMRTVCQDSSLNINTNPFVGSFRRVTRKSPCSHFGVFDSTRIRDI